MLLNKKNCQLFQLGKRRILIETGLIFLNELSKMGLINNLYLFKSSVKLGSGGFNNTKKNFLKSLKNLKQVNVNLNNDSLFKSRVS